MSDTFDYPIPAYYSDADRERIRALDARIAAGDTEPAEGPAEEED